MFNCSSSLFSFCVFLYYKDDNDDNGDGDVDVKTPTDGASGSWYVNSEKDLLFSSFSSLNLFLLCVV